MAHSVLKTIRLDDVCRLCVGTDKPMSSIYFNDAQYSFADKIKCLASVQVSEDDGLPCQVCDDCRSKIEGYIIFKEQIENSYNCLISIVTNNVTSFFTNDTETELQWSSPRPQFTIVQNHKNNNTEKTYDIPAVKNKQTNSLLTDSFCDAGGGSISTKRRFVAMMSDTKSANLTSEMLTLDMQQNQNCNKDTLFRRDSPNFQICNDGTVNNVAVTFMESDIANRENLKLTGSSHTVGDSVTDFKSSNDCLDFLIRKQSKEKQSALSEGQKMNAVKIENTKNYNVSCPLDGFDNLGKYLKSQVNIDYEKLKADMQILKKTSADVNIEENGDAKRLWEKLAQKGVVTIKSKIKDVNELKTDSESELKNEIFEIGNNKNVNESLFDWKRADSKETTRETEHTQKLVDLEQFVKQDVHTEAAPRISELHGRTVRKKCLMKGTEMEHLFVCHLCLYSIKTSDTLVVDKHSAEHFKDVNKGSLLFQNSPPFQCEMCQEHFNSRHSFILHQRAHLNINPFKCNSCDKCFPSDEQLIVHESLHIKAARNTKIFVCNVCDKRFTKKQEFKYHESSHLPRQKVVCPTCKKVFTNHVTLRIHQRRHDVGNVYRCDQCPMSFHFKNEYFRHQQKHSGVKQFLCGKCVKCFCTSSELKRHENYHSKEKKHACKVCNKRFYEAGHLAMHMRTHTKNYSHICDVCAKAFLTMTKLKRHLKTHETSNRVTIAPVGETIISKMNNVFVQGLDRKMYCKLSLNELNRDSSDESYIIVTESDGEADNIFLKTESDNVQMFTDSSGAFYYVNDTVDSENRNAIVMIEEHKN